MWNALPDNVQIVADHNAVKNSLHFACVVDDTKCILVMCVCLSDPHCIPTLLHGPGCNLGEC